MAHRFSSVQQLNLSPKHDVFPSPRDWRDVFMYQLLIDRFDDCIDRPLYDPTTAKPGRDVRQGTIFQGGKIKGITRRLDYIKGLGCNAIWISPPFKQRADDPHSYHGYGIQDFLAVDPRFGTTDDLRELVRAAHDRGMYVILDIVINHAGDVFDYVRRPAPYRKEGRYAMKDWHRTGPSRGTGLGPDDGVWPIELQDPECFKRKGAIRDLFKAGVHERIDGDFYGFKDIDLNNRKALDALTRCYKYWIAETDIDGYRIDTVAHVEPHACSAFCNAIREYAMRIGKHNFLLFGEIIADDETLHCYIGANVPHRGSSERYPQLDAVLDYPLCGLLDEIIKGEKSCEQLQARYERLGKHYRNFSEAAKYYVTFIDNHDQPHRPYRRFLHKTGDWRVGVLGAGYLLCNLGIPCIYYGTEQGFDGGGDSDAFIREAMFGGNWGAFNTTDSHFFNTDHPIYRNIASLAQARATLPPLRYGRQYFRDISADGEHFTCPKTGKCIMAFSRILDCDEVLCAMNLDSAPRNEWIRVEYDYICPGEKMVNVLNQDEQFEVAAAPKGGAMVRVPLEGRQMKILMPTKMLDSRH